MTSSFIPQTAAFQKKYKPKYKPQVNPQPTDQHQATLDPQNYKKFSILEKSNLIPFNSTNSKHHHTSKVFSTKSTNETLFYENPSLHSSLSNTYKPASINNKNIPVDNSYIWIDKPEYLFFLMESIKPTLMGVDTEFWNWNNFSPVLCLVQLAFEDGPIVLVDPFARGILSILANIMTDLNICKIFHAASEDIKVLCRSLKAAPMNILDTQVGASLLGMGTSIGYANLVQKLCHIDLSKSQQTSNWKKRPLSQDQKIYALHDVRYLFKLHNYMLTELEKIGKREWWIQDGKWISQNCCHEYYFTSQWSHLNMPGIKNYPRDVQLNMLRLSRWREIHALVINKPKTWFLTDKMITQLALLSSPEPHHIQNILKTAYKESYIKFIVSHIYLYNAIISPLPDEYQAPTINNFQSVPLEALIKAANSIALQNGIPGTLLVSKASLKYRFYAGIWPLNVASWKVELLEPAVASIIADKGEINCEIEQISSKKNNDNDNKVHNEIQNLMVEEQ